VVERDSFERRFLNKANNFASRRKLNRRAERAVVQALEPRWLLSGTLDPTFGTSGVAISSVPGQVSTSNTQIIVEPDDSYILGAQVGPSISLAKYNTDGSLDTSFGTGGSVNFQGPTTDGSGQALGDDLVGIAQTSNGDIVAVGHLNSPPGYSQIVDVFEFNPNGTPNTAFGNNGLTSIGFGNQLSGVASMTLDSANYIYVGGWGYQTNPQTDNVDEGLAVARFTPSGALDNSYGGNGNGVAFADIQSLVLPNIFESYTAFSAQITSLTIDGNNDDVLCGGSISFTENGAPAPGLTLLAWFNTGGELDDHEGISEFVSNNPPVSQPIGLKWFDGDPVSAIAAFPGGNDVIVSQTGVITELDSDGNTLDSAFGAGGQTTLTLPGNAPVAGPFSINLFGTNEDIFIAGSAVFSGSTNPSVFVSAFTQAGLPDTNFGLEGVTTYNFGPDSSCTDPVIGVDSGGYPTIASNVQMIDPTTGYVGPGEIGVAEIDASGGFITSFGNFDGGGSELTPFLGDADMNTVSSSVIQSVNNVDKIIIAYVLAEQDGEQVQLSRYNSNGTLDTSFGNGGYVLTDVFNSGSQPQLALYNGEIYVADQPSLGGTVTVEALTSNGTPDPAFGGDVGDNNNGVVTIAPGVVSVPPPADSAYFSLSGLAVDGDGFVYIEGVSFSLDAGAFEMGLIRLDSDGSPDELYGDQDWATADMGTIAALGGAINIDSAGDVILGATVSDPISGDLEMSIAELNPLGVQIFVAQAPDFDANVDLGAITQDVAGNIYAVGTSQGENIFDVLSVMPDGDLNTGFGGGSGMASFALPNTQSDIDAQATGVAVDSAGNVIVAGWAVNTAVNIDGVDVIDPDLGEILPSGGLNPAFGDGGGISDLFSQTGPSQINSMSLDSEGRIVATGTTIVFGDTESLALARVNDLTSGPAATTMTVQSDSILYGGSADLLADVDSTSTVNSGSVTFTILDATNTAVASASAPVVNGVAETSLSLAPLNAGSYTISAAYADTSGQFLPSSGSSGLTITAAAGKVTLSDLTQTYTGSPIQPTVVTVPADLHTTIEYSQSGQPVANPTDAGTYEVSVVINNSDYLGTALGELVIMQATPSVSVTAPNATYDGTPHGATAFVTGVGGANLETPSLTYYAGASATGTPLASAPVDAGTYTVMATYGGDLDYLSSGATATYTIAQATANISVTAANATYDAMAQGASASVTGVGGVSLEAATLTYYVGTSASGTPLASAPVDAGTYTVLASYAGDADYLPGTAAATYAIGQAAPTISLTAANTTYDGTAQGASAPVTGVIGESLGSASLTYYAGSSASGTPLASVPVDAGTYSVVASYAGNTDYTSASATATYTVGQATPNISITAPSATYDGTPHGASAPVTGVIGENLGTASLMYYAAASATGTPLASAPVDAGTYTVLASYAGDTDYTSASATATYAISQATPSLTITAANATYDGTAHGASAPVTGVGGVSLGSASLVYYAGSSASGTPLGSVPVDAGTYTVSASYGGSMDYTAASATATYAIAQATPSISIGAPNAVYDGNPHGATATVSGVGGVNLGSASLTYYAGATASGTPLSSAPSAAGTYTVLASYAGGGDYTSASNTATYIISQASLVISINAPNAVYDASAHGATATVTGSGGVNLGSASLTYYAGTSATGTPLGSTPINAGTYTVLASFAGSGNYAAASNTATYVISQAAVTITANNQTRTYGSANPTLTVTYSGFVGGQTSAVLTTQPTVTTTATQTSGVGTYPITASGAAAINYTFTYGGGTLTITKAALSVTVNNVSRAYGAANPTFTSTVTGLANGNTLNISYTTSATLTSNIGTYGITATVTAAAGVLANYNLTVTNGTLTVTKAALSVTVNNVSRAYGSANPTFSSTVSGLVNGNTINISYSTTATRTSSVGLYAINGTVTAAPGVLANYNLTVSNGTLTVAKAALTVTANSQTKVYGQTNPALSGSISGIENGDNITATFSTAATPSSNVGEYAITATLNDPTGKLSNYAVTIVPAKLTITPATLLIMVNPVVRFVGQANPAFTLSYFGFVLGQNSSVVSGAPVFSTSATAGSPVGIYTVNVSGLSSSNYNIIYIPGLLIVI
jgi:uncharacterized delta-60 repeat protein